MYLEHNFTFNTKGSGKNFQKQVLNLCVKNRLFKCVEMVFSIFFGHQVLQLRQRQNLATPAGHDFFLADLKQEAKYFDPEVKFNKILKFERTT